MTCADMCVLTIHRVQDVGRRGHDVGWRQFREVVEGIADRSTKGGPGSPSSSAQRILVTFDDGTEDHREASKVLSALGLRGIFFVPTALIGRLGFLTRADVQAIADEGHEIGAHGHSHHALDRMRSHDVVFEVRSAAKAIHEMTGRSPRWFAPPGGRMHRELPLILAQHRFELNRTMQWGIWTTEHDQWHIPCVPVTQWTVARRWPSGAIASGRLPRQMRFVAIAKRILPTPVASSLREAVTR